MPKKPDVAIIMGSKSDEPVMQKCLDILDQFGIAYKSAVMSAHRTPNRVGKFCGEAQKKGFKVIIAGAGLAAALPGTAAAHTTLPVIGVPLDAGPLRGQDALYAIAQMPPGIPVATVGIGNAKNAAYLAISILALSDNRIDKKLKDFRKSNGDI